MPTYTQRVDKFVAAATRREVFFLFRGIRTSIAHPELDKLGIPYFSNILGYCDDDEYRKAARVDKVFPTNPDKVTRSGVKCVRWGNSPAQILVYIGDPGLINSYRDSVDDYLAMLSKEQAKSNTSLKGTFLVYWGQIIDWAFTFLTPHLRPS